MTNILFSSNIRYLRIWTICIYWWSWLKWSYFYEHKYDLDPDSVPSKETVWSAVMWDRMGLSSYWRSWICLHRHSEMINWSNQNKAKVFVSDDFSPVLSLERYNVDTWPVRLPARISSPFDKELQQILISLREAQIDKIILHSMKKDVIKNVIAAVSMPWATALKAI